MLCINQIKVLYCYTLLYLHVFLDLLLLVSEFSEGVNDQTYNICTLTLSINQVSNIKNLKIPFLQQLQVSLFLFPHLGVRSNVSAQWHDI